MRITDAILIGIIIMAIAFLVFIIMVTVEGEYFESKCYKCKKKSCIGCYEKDVKNINKS